jgi:hypothetical protein
MKWAAEAGECSWDLSRLFSLSVPLNYYPLSEWGKLGKHIFVEELKSRWNKCQGTRTYGGRFCYN